MNHSCARAANQRPVARRDSLSKIPLLWLTNCDLCGWRLAGRIDRALNFSASWGRVWVLLTAESLRLVKRHQSHDTPWVAACHEDWDGRREFRSKWSQHIARICCQRRWREAANCSIPSRRQRRLEYGFRFLTPLFFPELDPIKSASKSLCRRGRL